MVNERIKTTLSFCGRLGLSVVLLVWLFSKIDLKHMVEALKGADFLWIFGAFIVFVFTIIIILWRWRLLMKTIGLKATRFEAVRWFFIGQFCNLFLPTSVGGDVVKGLGLAKEIGNKPKVFASIVLDRLSGFCGIVLTGLLAFSFGGSLVNDRMVVLAIIAMTAVSVTIAVIFFSGRIFTAICKIFTPLPKFKQGLLDLHDDLLLLRGQWLKGVESIALSMFAQVVLAFAFYLTAVGMHQDINIIYFIIFSPIVCVATSLPSIGGLGVRELGWVYLLSKIGVHEGVALGLSLVSFAFMVIIGIFGGILYVTTLSHRRVQSS